MTEVEVRTSNLLAPLLSMLGIELAECSDDMRSKLVYIIRTAWQRLKTLLGGIEPPAELEYIVVEVAIIRFNRIGSEGIENHSVEGESQTFTDDDFKAYSKDIQAFLERQKEGTRGRLRFI